MLESIGILKGYDKKLHLHWNNNLVLSLATGGICLDLGCGDGLCREFAENLNYKWIGLDCIRQERTTCVADAHFLPFGDEVFDMVLSTKVLEHLARPWEALREVNRVLKPSGIFLGSVAFMETFHSSYFHFTHLGIKSIFEHTGFIVKAISPGRFGTTMICNSLLHPIRLTIPINLFTRIILELRRKFGVFYAKITEPKNLDLHKRAKTLAISDKYRFAGEFSFLAIKR